MAFFRFDGETNTALGVGLQGVSVYVLTQPANTGVFPPTPLATIYADSAGTPLANPVISDGLGNFNFYAATGTYTLYIFDPLGRIQTQILPDQQVVSPGGGSVTSVALSMPAEFGVAGSPLTSAGTLAVSKVNQNANLVYAGPIGGGAAAPGFRSLVSADLPAGVGSVTSVAATFVSSNAIVSAGVSGSPITSSGTIALTVGLANQNANTFLAGPTSGGAGNVTARAIVAADLFLRTVVAFSTTPTFNAALAAIPVFDFTLTASTVSSTVSNATDGQVIRFMIRQNGTGGWAFVWPADFKGASPVSTDPNTTSVQDFVRDGAQSKWRAIGPGMVSAT